MITLAFRFPAGRYHATPWGRHVNEADVEWPPSPWRILRALIAVYWRKADRSRFSVEDLAGLIDALASCLPVYRLPEAVHAHSRHYMPTREGSSEKTTLVFDAFARVDAADVLAVTWQGLELSRRSAELLSHLVPLLGYLGRAEAWVECEVHEGAVELVSHGTMQRLWSPHGENHPSAADDRLTPLLASLTADQWQAERARHLAMLPAEENRSRAERGIAATLHPRLADAIACDTADWQAAGWGTPPSARRILYHAPALPPVVRRSVKRRTAPALPTVARFVLAGRPLPPVEDTLRIGELMRLATLAQFGHGENGRRRAPPLVSGRAEDGQPLTEAGHAHAFFLPEDADNDGKIDHIVVFAPEPGMDTSVQAALDRVTRLWVNRSGRGETGEDEARGRKEWRLALEGFGQRADFIETRLFGPARRWTSTTPYLRPWHAKPRFGVPEQIRRELAERGILSSEAAASVSVALVDELIVAGRPLRPVHFQRFRARRGLTQPDKLGAFVSLTMPTEVSGPLSLGFASHFGLGLFRSDSPTEI